MKKFILSIVTLSLLMISCDDFVGPNVPTELFTEEDIARFDGISGEGADMRLTITPRFNWTARTSNSWISVLPDEGYGGEEVTLYITIGKNGSTSEREGSIRVDFINGEIHTLPIRQLGQTNSDTPSTNVGIYGSWHIKSYCGAPSEVDIYMQLNSDYTFKLYQRSGTSPFSIYSGTFSLNESTKTISGRYSDGVAWANSYYYSINSEKQLVFQNTNNSSEITIYEPSTMPATTSSINHKGEEKFDRFL